MGSSSWDLSGWASAVAADHGSTAPGGGDGYWSASDAIPEAIPYNHLTCHECGSTFRDDNHMAQHAVLHRASRRGDPGASQILNRQRQRSQREDLERMAEELRSE